MGYNTTVVIMNDALDQIEKDPEIGKKLSRGVSLVGRGETVDVSAGNHGNAMTVIETHHADQYNVVAVGGNYAINFGTVWPEYRVSELNDNGDVQKLAFVRAMASKLGYTLTKKRSHKK